MKGDKLKKHPNAHALAHSIMVAGSACKQDLHREDGEKLVALCNEFSEMFWDMKGIKTRRKLRLALMRLMSMWSFLSSKNDQAR